MTRARSNIEIDLIDNHALKLAMLPLDERLDVVMHLPCEVRAWVGEELPDLSEAEAELAIGKVVFQIVARAAAIVKVSGGLVGRC